jgi:D-alanyl-D-alanine carboxypeptidase
MRYHLSILTFILVGLSTCQLQTEKQLKADLQKLLDQLVATPEIPGASLAIIGSDDRTYTVCAGWADQEALFPMNDQHLLFSGSIGKTYVGAIILQLIEEGLLGLDDPVSDYLGDQSWYHRIPNNADLTIRMLLNHTSGIPRYVFKPALWELVRDDPFRSWTGEERLSYIFDDTPLHAAGEGWGYSDTNYILLGMLVEQLTGEDFSSNLLNRILIPLKLENTRAATDPYLPGLAAGYTAFSADYHLPVKMYENSRYAINPQLEWTGGGMVSTPTDLAAWARILYGSDFISAPLRAKMKSPGPWPTELGTNIDYGFATFIWEDDPVRYGHTGFMFGYMAIVEYLPERDIAIALQLNCDRLPEGDNIAEYTQKVREILNRYEK